ncbi:hypothetical protein [Sorangium cellulosum]|uniref:hypothetical protein n=1 Tax=Sorangium cellulosum TaxID=56 RepID=UPI000AE3B9E5|nr:hypothetical protein [Sorangium cellulosum]
MTIGSEMSAAARSAERGFHPGLRASGALGQLFTGALPAFHKGLRGDGRRR